MSSSSGRKYNTVLMKIVMMVAALLVMSLGIPTTSAQEVSRRCNGVSFHLDDYRRVCAFHLLDHLLGWSDPVKEGKWYDTYDCDYGRNTVYGYRWAEGAEGIRCLGTAKDILQNRDCRGRIGGTAWGEGCYMRFELYDFEDED